MVIFSVTKLRRDYEEKSTQKIDMDIGLSASVISLFTLSPKLSVPVYTVLSLYGFNIRTNLWFIVILLELICTDKEETERKGRRDCFAQEEL